MLQPSNTRAPRPSGPWFQLGWGPLALLHPDPCRHRCGPGSLYFWSLGAEMSYGGTGNLAYMAVSGPFFTVSSGEPSEGELVVLEKRGDYQRLNDSYGQGRRGLNDVKKEGGWQTLKELPPPDGVLGVSSRCP